MRQSVMTVGREGETAMTSGDVVKRIATISAPTGLMLAKTHFPPYGAIAGLALGIAVWQYLVLERRVAGRAAPVNPYPGVE